MSRRAAARDEHDDLLPDGEPTSIVRRAPFADSPFVGERGQKAQLRILETALEVFGEVGYHGCGVRRITELSGCSRASFYQYFSSKEDLFRHLAGRVARELNTSAAAMAPITGDLAGWESLHGWLSRYSAIYNAYEPVFVTFQTAVQSDAMVASGASVVLNRSINDLRKKIVKSPLSPARIDKVVGTLLQTVGRLNRETALLDFVAPTTTLDRHRATVAFADVFHRTLFEPDAAVNVHTPSKGITRLPTPEPLASTLDISGDPSLGPGAQRTRSELLEAGHRVFIERGYYRTRVSDIVEAAGLSHGVFYRYFENKGHLFRILAEQASLRLNQALDSLPSPLVASEPARPDELRGWLRRYADTYASEAAIFTMWSEAMSRDRELGDVSAAIIDGSRHQLARYLEPRGWGDIEADALVLLVFLDGMTAQRPTTARIESMAQMIERGLLVGPPSDTARVRSSKSTSTTARGGSTTAVRASATPNGRRRTT